MDWKTAPSSQIVCYCLNITKGEIVNSIRSGCTTLDQIKESTKACTGKRCKELNPSGKCCSGDIIELLQGV